MLDVLICYEHKAREYLYYSLIKYEMQRRGYSVRMCHYSFRNHWIYQIFSIPKIVLGPWGHGYKIFPERYDNTLIDWCMDTLRGRAKYYVNMQMEQVFRKNKAKVNVDLTTQDYVYNVCWGELRKQQLIDLGFSEDKLLLTGAVHLDCLRSEFDGLYRSKEAVLKAYGIPKDKQWVLFISGFVFASKPEAMVKREANQLIQSGGDITVDDMLRIRNISIMSQSVIMEWIGKYLEDNDTIFIYRPHPGEFETKPVRDMRNKFPDKFFFIADEPIQQWIKVCDLVMLWNSTAIAEVYAAKKKCCVVQPFPLDTNLQPPLLDHGHIIESYDAMVKELSGSWEFDLQKFPIKNEIMDKYYCFNNKMAYLKICDYLEEIIKKPKKVTQRSKFTWSILLSKFYLRLRYMDFYCLTHIKLSNILLFWRKKLKSAETAYDTSRTKLNVEFSKEEKKLYKKAKKFVYEKGEK